YLSAGALARLSAVPDGLIVLSPDGYEPESSIGQGVTAAMERGVPLLGVVRERWTPAADQRSVAPPPGRISASVRRPPHRLARPVVVAATLLAGAAGGWALLARGAEQRRMPAPAVAAPVRARPVAAAPAPARLDSLAWTVQLAAYARLDKALALADRLTADGVTPFVTPVALDDRRGSAVWYRVLAGAFPTRDSAVGARADGGVARGERAGEHAIPHRAPPAIVQRDRRHEGRDAVRRETIRQGERLVESRVRRELHGPGERIEASRGRRGGDRSCTHRRCDRGSRHPPLLGPAGQQGPAAGRAR